MSKSSLLFIAAVIIVSVTACVPKRHLIEAQRQITYLRADSSRLTNERDELRQRVDDLENRIRALSVNNADKSSETGKYTKTSAGSATKIAAIE